MKKIIIIAPHFPPSNLTAVHRSRLFAKYLPCFGWEPVVITVKEKFYEETLDLDLEKQLSPSLRIEKVNAFPVIKVGKFRLVGDIGLRSFFQILFRIFAITKKEKIDFIYIPIPPFYTALLGRLVHYFRKIRFGIDYIDPWVHEFPGSKTMFSRAWFSRALAKILEPFAIRKASLITGVAASYYQGTISRNNNLDKTCKFAAMPYGVDITAKLFEKETATIKPLFLVQKNKFQLIYAGALLPKSVEILEMVLKIISQNEDVFSRLEIHLIGTGQTTNDPEGYNIKPMAEKYGLWNKIIFEYPERIAHSRVLANLASADGVFILGSTQPHYTPSKVWEAMLVRKPVFAILNTHSAAVSAIKEARAGVVVELDNQPDWDGLEKEFVKAWQEFQSFVKNFKPEQIDKRVLNTFSAKSITKILAESLNSL